MFGFFQARWRSHALVALVTVLQGCSAAPGDYVGYWQSNDQDLFVREDGDLLRFDFRGGPLGGIYSGRAEGRSIKVSAPMCDEATLSKKSGTLYFCAQEFRKVEYRTALKSSVPRERAGALRALLYFSSSKRDLDLAIGALAEENRLVKDAAIEALSALGEAAAPALSSALGNKVYAIRQGAVEALAQVGPSSLSSILPQLESDDPETRIHAATAIGRLGQGATSAADAVAKLLSDAHYNVRWHAAWALERVGVPQDAEIVLRRLASQDDNPSVREQAARTIASGRRLRGR